MSVERSGLSVERPAPRGAVFLSYASQDAEAAKRICETLRATGVEVWFDQNELVGGDAWDAKIRKQIAECALFVPIISAATQARREGYFRIEWRLAAQRTHAMADGTPFLLPVVIDDTHDASALVPAEFRAVQWTRPEEEEPALAKFVARVQTLLGGEGRDASPRRPSSDASEDPGRLGETSLPGKASRPWLVPVILGVAVVAVLAIWWPRRGGMPVAAGSAALVTAGTGSAPKPLSVTPAPENEKSVAVLSFKNLSGDPAREFFSDGLSEAVTEVLGRVPGLKVVGSASAFSFKGKSVPIPEIARQLGVTHLVEGTVIQDGATVRITAKLSQSDGFQVWVSDKLDRELKNIFALHDEVAGLIAKNLSLKLGASSAAATTTVNPQAFELYVQARQAWSWRTLEAFDLAESLLTRALALEPNLARAHAALADVWMTRLAVSLARSSDVEAQAKSAELARIMEKARHALALDHDSAEAHASLGQVLWQDGRISEGESAVRRAVALNPNYASAHQWLGQLLLIRAQMDEALEHLQRATELDPLTSIIWSSYGGALRFAGRLEKAIVASDRALGLQPNSWIGIERKGQALIELGRAAEAVALARQLSTDVYRERIARWEILTLAGQKAEAEALITGPTVPRGYRGLFVLGRTEEALTHLDPKAVTPSNTAEHIWNPLYDPVRNDPRWVKFIADAGLTEAHVRAQAWRKAHPPGKPAPKP